MATLLRSLTGGRSRSGSRMTLDDLAAQIQFFAYNGLDYGFISRGTLGGDRETIDQSFTGYVQGAYKRNGVIFSCMLARLMLFSQARFQFRRLTNGRPGDLFGTQELAVLETPWTNGTTGDLLARMIQDVDLAGNFYGARRGDSIRRMFPDRVTILLGSRTGRDIDREVVGYAYEPPPESGDDQVQAFGPEGIVHFAPIPDPDARFRGMSWLTPVIREVMGDSAATTHKLKFFENGATPNLVVTMGDSGVRMTPDVFEQWVDKFEGQHTGVLNAYKTLYLAAGAEAKVIGADMKQIDFKVTQGAGETRIAAASGMHPVIVGLSEGLQGSALNAGNFKAAFRLTADKTLRWLWQAAAAALAPVVNVPAGAQLWYDDRDIAALQEDAADEATIQQIKATTIAGLVKEGFTAESAVAAVMAGDMTLLEHTGMVSVQLHPPGEGGQSALDAPASQNGNGQPLLPASTS